MILFNKIMFKHLIVILGTALIAAGCNSQEVGRPGFVEGENIGEIERSGDEIGNPGSFDRTDDPQTTRSFEETGDMDCGDFPDQSEAQQFFEDEGGPDDDYHNLDSNGDGEACESYNY